MPDIRAIGRARISAWLRHWGPLLPLLGATLIVMLGFGAVIPVLPLFVQSKGIDATTLGIIVAGWAIGRLISEPFFGWWADSHSRKPQMVASLLIVGITAVLMLVFTSAAALFTLRFIAGIASGMFGPAARGSLVDATDKGSRGQAFGYFSAFQMGGFVLGPAIGAFGSSIFGGFAFPFVFMGVLGLVSAAFLWRFQPAHPHVVDPLHRARTVDNPLAHTGVLASAAAETRFVADEEPGAPSQAPSQAPISALFNRVLVAAVIIGFGLQLTFGIYDVVWPLYLIDLGASIEWVGLTFMLIGIPSMILAPIMGRWVDRYGSIPFVVAGCLVMVGAALVFASAWEPLLPSVVVTFEAGFSGLLGTALFAMVASGSPHGRTALAQGIYGSVGTSAIIVSAMASGALWEAGKTYPFWFFAAGVAGTFLLGMLVYSGFFGRFLPQLGRVASAEAETPA
ncbi:MAG: MFS transporter [Chloroflexota bacterium]|nr:MFS transporter [Chloroflexota bacterium]